MFKVITILFFFFMSSVFVCADNFPTSARSNQAYARVKPELQASLAKFGLEFGAPVFLRVFKSPGILELWMESKAGTYIKFKEYEICRYSGVLGPKQKQGDKQSPEGFYKVTVDNLNPWSRYHLSFNLGYPNTYDKLKGRTGSALMVHGECISEGCFAMTNSYMDEIYVLASAALKNGQSELNVHSFPFKLDGNILSAYKDNPWQDFWGNLKEGYDYFNQYKRPPRVAVTAGNYTFSHSKKQPTI